MEIWQPDTSRCEPSDIRPLDEDMVENCSFNSADWTDLDQTGATFDTCDIFSVELDGVIWHKTRMVNSVVGQINTAQLDATDSSWERVKIENCRLGVLDLTEATLKNLQFVGCKIDLLNVRGAKLSYVLFQDCSLGEVDLTNATVSQSAFESSTLNHLLVPQASLADFNLAGAELTKITGVSSLRGASINHIQLQQLAPIFAEELGINITNQ